MSSSSESAPLSISKPPSYNGNAERTPRFRVYKRRWLMLTLFSLLALCNNFVWFVFATIFFLQHSTNHIHMSVCLIFKIFSYTFAPISDVAIDFYNANSKGLPLDLLITIFFVTYCIFAFPSSRFIERYGLRLGVVLGSLSNFCTIHTSSVL
jgi:MFS family permease